ncbi:MAG: hypothetical protein WCJ78_05125 [Chloroflexota bacterium]
MTNTPRTLPALTDLDPAALSARIASLGLPAFRATQALDAAWRSPAKNWSEVTTLSQEVQQQLAAELEFDSATETVRQEAEDGATTKLLLTLRDGQKIEAVLMRYPADRRKGTGPRATICVSSQAGCAVGCPFCATGELGFGRNLTSGEIQDQVRAARPCP